MESSDNPPPKKKQEARVKSILSLKGKASQEKGQQAPSNLQSTDQQRSEIAPSSLLVEYYIG
jgi:hypothetical protein